jgi:dynein heavy chain, axonemal
MTPLGKAVNAQGSNDNEVLFGEISEHIVPILNTMINQVYKPLVDRLEKEDWNLCESEQKKEFCAYFDKFAKELQEAMDSQKSKITLESFPEKFRNSAKNFVSGSRAQDTHEMISEFERLFDKWQVKIEAALAEAEAEQKKSDRDAGPAAELEYWKQRMRKLTGIAEQLRTKNCRTVVEVLDYAGRPSSDQVGAQKDKIYLATSNWNSMENRVTEALNEAKDNVKYLQTLEKFLEPLYNGNPASIRDTLPALMNSIKMIHTIARYYNTNERMTGLFVKITNQMINNCKYNILNFRKDPNAKASTKKGSFVDDSCLWDDTRYPPNELIEVLRSCQALKDAYIRQYNITKQRLEEMPKAKKFDFNTNEIFGKFELFSRRIGKLIDLFSTIRQFKTLEKHNLENIQPIVNQFN